MIGIFGQFSNSGTVEGDLFQSQGFKGNEWFIAGAGGGGGAGGEGVPTATSTPAAVSTPATRR